MSTTSVNMKKRIAEAFVEGFKVGEWYPNYVSGEDKEEPKPYKVV